MLETYFLCLLCVIFLHVFLSQPVFQIHHTFLSLFVYVSGSIFCFPFNYFLVLSQRDLKATRICN